MSNDDKTKQAEELPGGAHLVGRTAGRDTYLCDDLHSARRRWPRRCTWQTVCWSGDSNGPSSGHDDLLVNNVALANLKEHWGFVPLAEPGARATYEGLEDVGTYDGAPVYVGAAKYVKSPNGLYRSVNPDRSDVVRADWPAIGGEFKGVALTPECLTAMLTWAKDGWTDLPECTGFPSKAGRQFYCPCSHGGGPRYALSLTVPCGRCGMRLAEKPSEAESELREKVLDAFAPMVDAVKEGIAMVAEHVGRHKVWGDMMTDRRPEKGGPILTVAAGRVSLHLDRLSDDRIKRGEQFWEARETTEPLCEDPSCRSTPMEKFHLSLTETWREHHEHDSLWHLERRLQGIRDAHERLGISQAWVGAKVKPAEGTEVDVEPVSIEGTPKPGWSRR